MIYDVALNGNQMKIIVHLMGLILWTRSREVIQSMYKNVFEFEKHEGTGSNLQI